MTDRAEMIKQCEFVEWLKANHIYNEFDSAETMRKAQLVWETARAQIADEAVDAVTLYFDGLANEKPNYHDLCKAIRRLAVTANTGE